MNYDLTYYFDVWTDEEGGFVVNDATILRRNIEGGKIDTDEKIIKYLKEVGLIKKGRHARSYYVSYSSDLFYEVYAAKNHYPICSFSAVYNV
jgi:hypothetical protein